jgi:predicted nuclease with RNAse H fold
VSRWLGVDVGGKRKRFDAALVDECRLLTLDSRLEKHAVLDLIEDARPALVAIDSPRSCAPQGRKTRADELDLCRRICGIRWTPDIAAVRSNPYYEWVVEGLALYESLRRREVEAIEVFPTASWTRWIGARGSQSRASWSRLGLESLELAGLPERTSQDQRDAIAAAVTARQHTHGETETIGEIVVPWPGARRPRRPERTLVKGHARTLEHGVVAFQP